MKSAAEKNRLEPTPNPYICLVPECGRFSIASPMLWPDDIPVCAFHGVTIWNQIERSRHRTDVHSALETLSEQRIERKAVLAAEEAEAHKDWLKSQDGEIYFIRLNHLVKVGWTRDLESRLKNYGASAELIVHYPARRSDETQLHRQLRPALAKGREWYRDCDIIQMFASNALATYGPPTVSANWTEPAKNGKRSRQRR